MGNDRRFLAGAAVLVSALLGMANIEGVKAEEPPGKVTAKESGMAQTEVFRLHPVGVVKRDGERIFLTIKPEYAPALQGIEGFSHLWVLYWFHGHDRPEERATLKVHPRRDPTNPLTGVFATRAPVRPNLIGLTACRLVQAQGDVLEVADLDAQDGSPILDLKPYIPDGDSIPGATTPEWLKKLHRPAK
jgi:tRNA-Thr(GGU) m(6)t(6)A37 methyltransferase TsaA